MNTVSFKLSICSHLISVLELVRRALCIDAKIRKDGKLPEICVLLKQTTEYDTDEEMRQIIDTIPKICARFPMPTKHKLNIVLDVDIVVDDADENSIPSIIFPSKSNEFRTAEKCNFHP